MMLIRNYVASSTIEGIGIFAGQNIKKGERIWGFHPLLDRSIPLEEVKTLPAHVQEFLYRYGYESKWEPGMLMSETDNGRFMNHSLAPNTDFAHADAGYALRDVAEGEELTCDYREFCTESDLFAYESLLGLKG